MIDVVIPLAHGSVWQDNELRYCLRSLEKHVQNIGKVFLVGYKPSFLNGEIIHIKTQPTSGNKAKNILLNVVEAAKDERLSEQFLFINDDYFFTKDIDAETYPFYWKCDLSKTVSINSHNSYAKHITPTIQVLKRYGLSTKNFDTHYPIRFTKTGILQINDFYTFPPAFGYVLKSLYCNTAKINGFFRLDCKAYHAEGKQWWRNFTADKEVFSIADPCLNDSLKNFLQDLFPSKSSFEK